MNDLVRDSRSQRINRGFFDKAHPAELIGKRLLGWSIRQSYNLGVFGISNEAILGIREEIYFAIINRLASNKSLDNHTSRFQYQICCYEDIKLASVDRDRTYLKIEIETVRGTLLTILLRIHKHGEHLYIVVDSYSLGKIKPWLALIHTFILLNLFTPPFIGTMGGLIALVTGDPNGWLIVMGLAIPILIFVVYFWIFWIDIVKALFQGENIVGALRQKFNKPVTDNSFDVDDVLIFLKIIWPLTTDVVERSFKNHGIESQGITDYLQEIARNSKNQGIQINTGGGGIFGSIFGGSNNSIEI
ncbi:hypothetical protein IQ266_26075 [filamentous cyanobacterium LEGE 11480]|uniref:Uncharacterized protein n=1 Tax=Romeriopsis navalis LEGE 11480 TaxID=2777977 RepID=A0A928VR40_9CYAN|nr:hypothetical protein [Romeriopsis navalis]MBE9033208.1 hypothetical protein [Romeriopsis navalis LEGE 11480]